MKIGVLTQPLHLNYGGILQAWALQQVLIRLGHEPEVISRYFNIPELSIKRLAWQVTITCWSIFDRIIRRNKKTIIYNPFKRKYGRWYPGYCDWEFVKNNIQKTKELFSTKDFESFVKDKNYDALLVGSDQVWREAYSPCIETYFLDFVSSSSQVRKISYGASFGTTEGYISEEKIAVCKELLGGFDSVSVREYGGLKILGEVFERKDAVKVLDPTLLLDAEDYKRLIEREDNINHNYIAAYILDESEDKCRILEEYSAESSLSVISKGVGYVDGKTPTISQWLANIANSKFVITDSFHGCVFSIIFRKPFIAIGNSDRGLDRFNSLLGAFNLSNRMVCSLEEFCNRKSELMQPIDYSQVEPLIKKHQELSYKFLTDALS